MANRRRGGCSGSTLFAKPTKTYFSPVTPVQVVNELQTSFLFGSVPPHQCAPMSAAAMFGIIVSGRIVQTDCQQVSETQFLFNIPDADSINHIVVFMTGQTPFPDGYGGAVYFSWPSPAGQSWVLLGHISNIKPSAIFKITNLKTGDSNDGSHPFGEMEPQSHLAQIGISVEPLASLAQQTPASNSTTNVQPFVEFSQKMCENLFNYLASFAQTQAQMSPNPTETYVPISTMQTWYRNFLRRLEQNPNFWKS